MVAFCLGGCDFNKNGWGPTRLPEQYLNLPYASFGKSDRLGKAADFTSNAHYHRYRPRHDVTGVNTEFQYKHDTQEDASFQLVDTVKGVRSKFSTRLRPFSSRVGRVHARFPQQQRRQPATQTDPHVRQKGQQQLNKRWDRLSKARRQYNTRRREEKRTDREASVQVNAEWKVIEQFDLSQLTKLSTAAPEVSDVKWCGSKFTYDDMYDRVSTRSEKPLAKFPDRDFYYVSTTDDPVIEDMAVEGKVKVFATDVILAHLMTSPRSVYPWDIVVNRVGDALFFDKREESKFDLLTVDETAFDSPNDEVLESINHPESLSIEATIINQNFSQQILKPETKEDLDNPSPFVEPNSCPAAAAYRYRQWDFTDEISLVARCELHGEAEKRGQKELFTAYALNEWDSKISKSTDYRMKIDAQRGAILATELKNNSYKLAKWTAQSILAGADQMKLGFVSRVNRADPTSHVILGTHSYKPRDFAAQIALNMNNMWGIMKMLIDFFMEQSEGKYVIMKDPNKTVVRIYSVPENTFEE